MVTKVNPPPQKVPQGLAQRDPELFRYLVDTQFQQYQMWRLSIQLGQDSEHSTAASTRALLSKVQNQIGSGQFLTCDDTGFTCDNDHFTCDMDQA